MRPIRKLGIPVTTGMVLCEAVARYKNRVTEKANRGDVIAKAAIPAIEDLLSGMRSTRDLAIELGDDTMGIVLIRECDRPVLELSILEWVESWEGGIDAHFHGEALNALHQYDAIPWTYVSGETVL